MNPLKQILVMSGAQLRSILWDKVTPIWLFALPIAIVGILGMGLSGLLSTDFVPEKPYSVAFVAGNPEVGSVYQTFLDARPEFIDVLIVPDEASARELVLQRRTDAAAIIPAAFPEQPPRVIAAPDSAIFQMLSSMLNRVTITMHSEDETINRARTEVPLNNTLAEESTTDPWTKADSYSYYAIAVTAMFVMFAAHSPIITSAKDRSTDVYARVRTFGVTPTTYMLAGSIASFVIGLLFIIVMILSTRLLFGLDWGDPLALVPLTLLGAAAAAGLSLVILALIPNSENVEAAGSAIFLPLAFLGGSMTPLHVLPSWFRDTFGWLPNRSLFSGYIQLSQGANLHGISSEIVSLSIATCVLLGVGWIAWTIRTRGESH